MAEWSKEQLEESVKLENEIMEDIKDSGLPWQDIGYDLTSHDRSLISAVTSLIYYKLFVDEAKSKIQTQDVSITER